MSSTSHVLVVRSLYKRILRLHQRLPMELKAIGDQYVKSEFKSHKMAKEEEVKVFMTEWMSYANQLEEQLRESGGRIPIGNFISVEQLEDFRPEQVGQLYELHQETRKPSPLLPPDNQS
ncbi:succinate dehydrogenase assembly factor 3, mitochondrial-like isoform X2 [Anneissia japonica]|nr:succinate dehydrogenase assembly factor 3, mitochondrial-like isoform X2 [Anneissia japonica]